MYILRRRTPRGFRHYGLGAMNCPGDPGCPGNPLPEDMSGLLSALPLTGPYTTGTGQTAIALAEGGQDMTGGPGGFTAWLNANGKLVAIGSAVFIGALVLTGGRRR